jgi:hypothetical protein
MVGALLALQSRELMAIQQQKAGSLNQRSLLQMAQSIRKIQEVGRMALGETTDRQQLDLDFDPPDIHLTIINGQTSAAARGRLGSRSPDCD